MDWPDDTPEGAPRKHPPVWVVLLLLISTASTFSYLGAYAVYNALVAAEVIAGYEPGHDPRPRWFMTSFVVLMLAFVFIGSAFKLLSYRDFKAIDAMAEAEE